MASDEGSKDEYLSTKSPPKFHDSPDMAKISFKDSVSTKSKEKIVVDSKQLKVEIYKDIRPLLGAKAVNRLISRSDA